MVIIHVMGGLGNQLYQYALYEKFRALGKEAKLDLYAYREDDPGGSRVHAGNLLDGRCVSVWFLGL